MKTVNLQIKGVYLDQIKAGEKIKEYRSISPYNTKLLCDHIEKKDLQPGDSYLTQNEKIWRPKKDLTNVLFLNGYRADREKLLCELKAIELTRYINKVPDEMKPGTVCFTLFLGRVSNEF